AHHEVLASSASITALTSPSSPGLKPKFIEQVNRFTARASLDRWAINLQLDQVAFVGLPYSVDGEVVRRPPPLILPCGVEDCGVNPIGEPNAQVHANPEKIGLTFEGDKVSWVVGDFYAAFGYGAALNLNRNVDIDIDTSIQGARVVYRPGEWQFTGLAGTLNRQQVYADNPNIRFLEGDLRHLIFGARAERFNLGRANVGIHAVGYDFVDAQNYGFQGAVDQIGSRLDAAVAGGTLDLFNVGGVDFQFEADMVGFPGDADGNNVLFIGTEPQMGHALYGSASFFTGDAIWVIDAKRYFNTNRVNQPTAGEQYQSIIPPTLEYERAINFNTAAAITSNDIFGGRIQVDLALGRVTPYFSIAGFRDADVVANAAQKSPVPENIGVVRTGVEALWDDYTLLANAQGRIEVRDDNQGIEAQAYADIDFKFPLPGKAHGDLIVFGQRFVAGPEKAEFVGVNDGNWTEVSVSLTVAPSHWGGVTGYFDYTTNPFAQRGGNLFDEFTFGAVEVYWKPSAAWTLKAFHGGYAAGIRCSGGQCRNVPAFTGSRVAIQGSF
ncbi:MAG: hypothetical protein AAF211_13500, partial [Myxococcota bacterium]